LEIIERENRSIVGAGLDAGQSKHHESEKYRNNEANFRCPFWRRRQTKI
jgi:hypothetical protein